MFVSFGSMRILQWTFQYETAFIKVCFSSLRSDIFEVCFFFFFKLMTAEGQENILLQNIETFKGYYTFPSRLKRHVS